MNFRNRKFGYNILPQLFANVSEFIKLSLGMTGTKLALVGTKCKMTRINKMKFQILVWRNEKLTKLKPENVRNFHTEIFF